MNRREMIVWITGFVMAASVAVAITVAAVLSSESRVESDAIKHQMDAENEGRRPLKLWERERKGPANE